MLRPLRPPSPRRLAVVPVALGAAILTAALLLFPREGEHPAEAAAAAADEVSPRCGLRGPGVAGRYLGAPRGPGDGPLPQGRF